MTIYLLTPDPKTNEVEAIEAKLKDIIPELRKIGKLEEIAAEIKAKPGGKVLLFLSRLFARRGD